MSEKTVPTCGPAPASSRGSDPLGHPLLAKYLPSERRAILVHRFYLSLQAHRDVSLEETLRSWESGICMPWRREKMLRDSQAQLKEIEKHKYLLSQKLGYDVGWEYAAQDWVASHAADWREWWEGLPEAGA